MEGIYSGSNQSSGDSRDKRHDKWGQERCEAAEEGEEDQASPVWKKQHVELDYFPI